MKKQFILGLIGGILGILTAIYVILSAVSSDQTLSGVQAALFSSLGLMGAVIANKETRFAGWMLIFAAVFITLSVPIAGSLNMLFLYMPAVVVLGISAVLCFMEPDEEKPGRSEGDRYPPCRTMPGCRAPLFSGTPTFGKKHPGYF